MEWLPAARLERVSEAEPLVNATIPITVPPSWNWTAPVAVAGKTRAVNVTAWPVRDGFSDEARPTAAAALATVTDTAPDVLARVTPSPPYDALMVCVPTAKLPTTRVAEPPLR